MAGNDFAYFANMLHMLHCLLSNLDAYAKKRFSINIA